MDLHQIKSLLKPNHTLPDHEWKGSVVFLCNEEQVFLIKRSEMMPTHGGQMAFIGGYKKVNEKNPWEVAQREFEEETSLDRHHLEFIGYLPLILTARKFPIIPVMAKISMKSEEFLNLARSNGEWNEIISYPWSELSVEKNWEFALSKGPLVRPILFHTIRSYTFNSPQGNEHPKLLWGATAAIVWDFLHIYFKG